MKRIRFANIIVIILMILTTISISSSEAKESPLKGLKIDFGFDYLNSSSYYDKNGDGIGELNKVDSADGSTFFDTYQFSTYSFSIGADYQINEFLNINLSLPFRMYYYDDKHHVRYLDTLQYQDGFYRIEQRSADLGIEKFSLTQLEHINIGTVFTPINGIFELNLLFNVIIPFGTSKLILDNPDFDLWYDGAFEIITGAGIEYTLEQSKLFFTGVYNSRDEGLSDRLGFLLKYAFTRIEDTDLNFLAEYQTSLGEFEERLKFNTKYPSFWENYLALGMGFGVDPTDNLRIYLEYSVKLLGENTSNSGIFKLISSYTFD